MKQLLVPVDYPKQAKNTIRNASVMAKKLDMGLILYHAMPLPAGFASGSPIGTMYGELETRKDHVHKELLGTLKEVTDIEELSYQTMVTYGNMARGIKQIEKYNELGLVLMYSKGPNGFIESMAGSNAYNVIQEMDCPVMVLPQDADISKMKSIALAGDYVQVIEPQLLQGLIDISKSFFAHIEVIHVQEKEALEDEQIDIGRSMDRYLKEVPHTFHFKTYDNVKEGLLAFCYRREVDLLALIPRQHSVLDRILHTSKTKELVHEIPMPLLVLQD